MPTDDLLVRIARLENENRWTRRIALLAGIGWLIKQVNAEFEGTSSQHS